MPTYKCSEDKKYWVNVQSYDPQSAAEDYAEREWWDSGCECPNRVVIVKEESGEETVWLVEGEQTMNFHAREESAK